MPSIAAMTTEMKSAFGFMQPPKRRLTLQLSGRAQVFQRQRAFSHVLRRNRRVAVDHLLRTVRNRLRQQQLAPIHPLEYSRDQRHLEGGGHRVTRIIVEPHSPAGVGIEHVNAESSANANPDRLEPCGGRSLLRNRPWTARRQ